MGIVRCPDALLGLPMVLNLSARWRTCSSAFFRSISDHCRPRSSDARRPVNIAVTNRGRQRPLRWATMARISSGAGMSKAPIEISP
jgi:hypothetical protein